jgi:hypothetical protein
VKPLVARYPGVCSECDTRFLPGEPITGAQYGKGYQHAACPEDLPEKPTRFVGSTDEEMGF